MKYCLLTLLVILFVAKSGQTQQIEYVDGLYRYNDVGYTSKGIEGVLKQDNEAHKLLKRSKRQKGFGILGAATGVGLLLTSVNCFSTNDSEPGADLGLGVIYGGAGIVSSIISVLLISKSSRTKAAAIERFNQRKDIGFGLRGNGITLSFKFK